MAKIYLLSNQKYSDVENLEVFHIEYIKSNPNLLNYDALIFTSKNAVYSLDSFNENWKKLDSYVIAPKTSQIIEKLGGKVVFTGGGSLLLKEIIQKTYSHAKFSNDAQFSNVLAFYKVLSIKNGQA